MRPVRRVIPALAVVFLAAALPVTSAAKPIAKPRWLKKVAITEYYPVPEKWFIGARRRAPGIPGTHRVDWLYGGAGILLEGDGVDLQGRRVHIENIGSRGWVDKNGKRTSVGSGSRPIFWRAFGWRTKTGKVTFPLDGGGWYRGLQPRKYTKPKGVEFGSGASLPLSYWRSIAVDPRVIKKGSRVYVPAYRNKPGGGWMRAVDTGSAIIGRHIDVYRPAPSRQGGASSYENQRIYVVPPKKRAVARGAAATPVTPAVPGDPIDIAGAKLAQHAFKLELHIRLAEVLRASDLTATGRSLCLAVYGSASPTQNLCIQRHKLVIVPGKGPVRTVRSQIKIGSQDVRVRFRYAVEKIRPGNLSWRVESADANCLPPRASCMAAFPGRGRVRLGVVAPRAIGCKRKGRSLVNNAGRGRKRIAITFDDGPGPYTPQVLAILKRFHVHATFFELGQQVRAYPAYSRAVLAGGHELANHSYNHPPLPPFAQLRDTSNIIHAATGFRPCNFRPPYGAVNGRLVADAARLKMSTIIWDVDPRDWSTPGTGAIISRVLGGARNGSIILNHDAGGPRGQTVAALPTILSTLKRRGYRFMPVKDLLGYKTTYSPR
ncbi:MAG: peptidoglycan-N-acetylglucosamine deacetylase [Candidatus Eremiobacteraeota bacterium]|nr:peptidoglycan-N-acetylglucosamine deacetylase [Candidatus Eremiobacteraeota bacterium]